VAGDPSTADIKSAARGPHWIAWVARSESDQSKAGVVLVGATQEEAEARARAWLASPYYSR
jgi:hypothetical protein